MSRPATRRRLRRGRHAGRGGREQRRRCRGRRPAAGCGGRGVRRGHGLRALRGGDPMMALLRVLMASIAVAFVFMTAFVGAPVWADDTASLFGPVQKTTPGGMGLTATVADGVAVTTPTQAGADHLQTRKTPYSTYPP